MTTIGELTEAKAKAAHEYATAWLEFVRAQSKAAETLRRYIWATVEAEHALKVAGQPPAPDQHCVVTDEGHCIGGAMVGASCRHDAERKP